MSDQQKIWFIYLTDHHEGPFTAAEIAEKAKAGLVNGQSLAWKDGMPEWVAAETIPELSAAVGGGGSGITEHTASIASIEEAPAAAAEPAPQGGEDGPSLAQLLAQSQQGAAPAAAAAAAPEAAPEPGVNEEVWTLKIGAHVSGLHSMTKLKSLAGSGEVPADAMLWHPGWSDFVPVSSVPHLDAARRPGVNRSGATKTSLSRPGFAVSALSNAAVDRDDEPTDTGLVAAPKGVRGMLGSLFARGAKKKVSTSTAKVTPVGAGKKTGTTKRVNKGGGGLKRAATMGLLLAVVGGAGAAYVFLFSSPIPSDLDVNEGDRESMVEAVKHPVGEGAKLVLAPSIGTPDNPPDPTAPKYYVATNLPEGTNVSLTVTGVPGTLVNRVSFEKTFTAAVEKTHIATFGQIADEGKPLWGEFSMKVAAEGAEPLDAGNRFIGNKGGAYQSRLKVYKDSVLGEYDKEITELREYVATLKNLQAETSKQLAEYKVHWATSAMRPKITGDWTSLVKNSQLLLSQIQTKLKERQAGEKQAKYHGRAFQDVATTVAQLEQLLKAHNERIAGTPPTANAEELDGLVQAGVQALEAWLATAVAKNPFDPGAAPAAVAPAAPPASAPAPAHAVAPAAAPAPAAPAPAAPAAKPVPGKP